MIDYNIIAPAWRILSVPSDTRDCHLLIIGLPSYSTSLKCLATWIAEHT